VVHQAFEGVAALRRTGDRSCRCCSSDRRRGRTADRVRTVVGRGDTASTIALQVLICIYIYKARNHKFTTHSKKLNERIKNIKGSFYFATILNTKITEKNYTNTKKANRHIAKLKRYKNC